MSTDRVEHPTWIMAIDAAATRERVSLPPATNHGMGSVSWQNESGERMVTFRRRLVPKKQAILSGIEWSFWTGANDSPSRLAIFRVGSFPDDSQVALILSLLSGWLLEGWTAIDVEQAISMHAPHVEAPVDHEQVK